MAWWPSGKATACKPVIVGSNPTQASINGKEPTKEKGEKMIEPYLYGEAVFKGHPDKIADQVADRIVDWVLDQDPEASIAVDAVIKNQEINLVGEISCVYLLDYIQNVLADVVHSTRIIQELGTEFSVRSVFTRQAPNLRKQNELARTGDQGVIVGYATLETYQRLPVAHSMALNLARYINARLPEFALPDGKCLVVFNNMGIIRTVEHVSISLATRTKSDGERLKSFIGDEVLPAVFNRASGFSKPFKVTVNPPDGVFVGGGTKVDSGLTGRKQIMDAYGCHIPTGGGALSGKDPLKLDRSGAYIARRLALQKLAKVREFGVYEVYTSLAYIMGQDSLSCNYFYTTHGTGGTRQVNEQSIVGLQRMLHLLELRKPIGWCYEDTAVAGHFGDYNFSWEAVTV